MPTGDYEIECSLFYDGSKLRSNLLEYLTLSDLVGNYFLSPNIQEKSQPIYENTTKSKSSKKGKLKRVSTKGYELHSGGNSEDKDSNVSLGSPMKKANYSKFK